MFKLNKPALLLAVLTSIISTSSEKDISINKKESTIIQAVRGEIITNKKLSDWGKIIIIPKKNSANYYSSACQQPYK